MNCAPRSTTKSPAGSLRMRPPAALSRSSTRTVCPACCSLNAAVRPAMPPPMTTMSMSAGGGDARRVGRGGGSDFQGCGADDESFALGALHPHVALERRGSAGALVLLDDVAADHDFLVGDDEAAERGAEARQARARRPVGEAARDQRERQVARRDLSGQALLAGALVAGEAADVHAELARVRGDELGGERHADRRKLVADVEHDQAFCIMRWSTMATISPRWLWISVRRTRKTIVPERPVFSYTSCTVDFTRSTSPGRIAAPNSMSLPAS